MNKREKILEIIEEANLFDEKYDEALMGYVQRIGDELAILYDKNKLFELFKYEALLFQKGHLYFTKASYEEVLKIDNGKLLILPEEENKFLMGYAQNSEGNIFTIYDEQKIIEFSTNENLEYVRKENPDFSEEEVMEEAEEMAIEFFEFNTAGAYLGKQTPGFATILEED